MRQLIVSVFFLVSISSTLFSQVDTAHVYKTGTPFGTLDIRLAKSATQYYYLDENRTISFRESAPGVKTNTFLHLTNWNSNDYKEGNLREKSGSNDNFVMNYRLLSPVNYTPSYNPGYPLIIMLHGLAERGNCWDNKCYHGERDWNANSNSPSAPANADNLLLNNELPLLNGGRVYLDARNLAGAMLPNNTALPARAFPGFVLVPQNLNGWNSNSVADAIRLIRLLVKKYNIDLNRIIIQGISNGGGGAFEALKQAPWLFCAALTMSPISDAFVVSQGQAPNIAHIPLWIFQGGKDTGPTPRQTERTIKALREAGASVRYSLYPNLGHGTWNTAYKEPDFFSWILNRNKAEIHTYAGNDAICLTNSEGVKLELATGFFNYQWQKNGVVITNATEATYVATEPGTYAARFSRVPMPASNEWTPWATPVLVTQQTPAQASLTQQGTVLLPDLNGNNDAVLNVKEKYAHYYWYKNESLLEFAGDQADTLQSVILKPSTGSGNYTVVTAAYDNCPSPVSVIKHLFFSNEAPVNISAPSDFSGQALSKGGNKLTWIDNANNEDGFEIWSRKIMGENNYSPWQLRILTEANLTTYTDTELEPLVTYQYKIRAVSDSGRSNYTPADEDEYLVVTTPVDQIKPRAPRNLEAKTIAINTISLSWDAPLDSMEIKQYKILYNGNTVTLNATERTHTLFNLTMNTIYHVVVVAEDFGDNLSNESNTATADTYLHGLYYEHTTGVWNDLDEVDWTLAEFTGFIDNFSLDPKTQDDYFNFKFDGYLNITTAGAYVFSTISSDGSRVMLDDVMVVNNNGMHDDVEVDGTSQVLTSGPKRITVTFFEYTGPESIKVKYKGPDTNNVWIDIPDDALTSGVKPVQDDKSLYFMVYPNPTTGNNINLKIPVDESDPLHIIILDSIGKIVLDGIFSAYDLNQGVILKTSEKLNDGLYVMHVTQKNRSGKFKIAIRN